MGDKRVDAEKFCNRYKVYGNEVIFDKKISEFNWYKRLLDLKFIENCEYLKPSVPKLFTLNNFLPIIREIISCPEIMQVKKEIYSTGNEIELEADKSHIKFLSAFNDYLLFKYGAYSVVGYAKGITTKMAMLEGGYASDISDEGLIQDILSGSFGDYRFEGEVDV